MDLIKLIAVNSAFTFLIAFAIIIFLKDYNRTMRNIVITIALISLTIILPHIGLLYGAIIILISLAITFFLRNKNDTAYKTMESFGSTLQIFIITIETYNNVNLWNWAIEYIK